MSEFQWVGIRRVGLSRVGSENCQIESGWIENYVTLLGGLGRVRITMGRV